MRHRLLPLLTAALALWPFLAHARETPGAGDEAFLKERINAPETSAVRLLLGGKALVTARERSTFTVTEEPGRAVVNLEVGTVVLGLVKELLKPNEIIEVRTPNAVVGVRGSLIRVDVEIINGISYTTVSVLEASETITVAPRANPTAGIHLLPDDTVSLSGDGAATRIGPIEKMTLFQQWEARSK